MSTGPNPFEAGDGVRPAVLTGRDAELTEVIRHLLALADGVVMPPLLVTARHGMGKTVFLHEVARQVRSHGWSPVVVPLGVGCELMVEVARGLAAAALHRARRAGRSPAPQLAEARAVAIAAGADLPLDTPPADLGAGGPSEVLAAALRAAGRSAREDDLRGGQVVLIDDAHHAPADDRRAVLDAVASAGREPARATIVLSGLPGTIPRGTVCSEVGLPRLDAAAAVDAVRRPCEAAGVVIDEAALRAIVRRCAGVPWFVQAMAGAAWPAPTAPARITVEDVLGSVVAAEHALSTRFFGPVLDTLDADETRIVRGVADLGEQATFPAVAHLLGDPDWFTPERSVLAPVCGALVRRGVLYPDGERLCLALPLLDRYLRSR
jgi:hypothetical protein